MGLFGGAPEVAVPGVIQGVRVHHTADGVCLHVQYRNQIAVARALAAQVHQPEIAATDHH